MDTANPRITQDQSKAAWPAWMKAAARCLVPPAAIPLRAPLTLAQHRALAKELRDLERWAARLDAARIYPHYGAGSSQGKALRRLRSAIDNFREAMGTCSTLANVDGVYGEGDA